MTLRAAILLQTGAFAKAYPTPSSGLYRLARRIGEIHFDRREVWLGVRTHDANLTYDVEEIVERGAKLVIHTGHSMGDGQGLPALARLLAARNRRVNLACMIDPVPMVGPHFKVTDEPFRMPPNVDAVTVARTVNKPPRLWDAWFTPWGRRVAHPHVVSEIVFGTDDPHVMHGNIDEQDRVHDQIIDAIGRALAA